MEIPFAHAGKCFLDWLRQSPQDSSDSAKIWLLVWLLYVLLFCALFHVFGRAAVVVNLLPALIYTSKYGGCCGVITVALLIPVSLLGFGLMGGWQEVSQVAEKFWLAQIGAGVLIFVLGRNTSLARQIERELAYSRSLHRQVLHERNKAILTSKEKDDLLAAVSHDLRTPLSGIIQSAQLLQSASETSIDKKIIDNIVLSGQQLLQVVDELLGFYRQKIQIRLGETVPFNIRNELTGIVQLMTPLFVEKALKLELVVQPDVPAEIVGNANLLRQVLFNLLGNSLKYTKTGGVTVEVSARPAESILTFAVEDSGVGMAAETIPAILDDSYRFSRTMADRKQAGYGLGLRNCIRMMEIMKGSLHLASELNKGTCVTLRLPLNVNTQINEIVVTPVPAENATAEPQGVFRVLLAEDSEPNIISLSAMLSSFNCRISVARSCKEVKALLSEPFDLILIDNQLADGNSGDAIKTLRQFSQEKGLNPYIVLITADAMRVDSEKKADMLLIKPIGRNELKDIFEFLAWSRDPHGEYPGDILNSEYLCAERKVLGSNTLAALLGAFLMETPNYLRDCLSAYEKRDYSLCAAAAHKITGAASCVGLSQLVQSSREVEQLSRKEDPVVLCRKMVCLVNSFNKSRRVLSDYLYEIYPQSAASMH